MFLRPWDAATGELAVCSRNEEKETNPSTGQGTMGSGAASKGPAASPEGWNVEKEIMQRGGRTRSVNCRVCPMLFPFPFFFPVTAGSAVHQDGMNSRT